MSNIELQLSKAGKQQRNIYKLGGAAAIILLAYSLETLIQVAVLGGPPATAGESFQLLKSNRIEGLLRLDTVSVFIMPFYYLLFYSIYTALKQTDYEYAGIGFILVCTGVTLFLATPSAFSMVTLSDKFAAAGSELLKDRYLAAGEAIIASDMWHGTGPIIGGIILQSAAVLISYIMLGSKIFGKLTSWVGIITHGLDLIHIILGFFWAEAGTVLMFIAGPCYLLWFPLVSRRLFLAAGMKPVR